MSTEQENNFITTLHDSQLTVIPWSVIQTKEFYALFEELKDLLSNQEPTHGTAGEFLITLKALLAKMKVIASLSLVIIELIPIHRLKTGDRLIVRFAVLSAPYALL